MNPYSMLGLGIGTSAASLSVRLFQWHDAMVAHERRLRAGRGEEACEEDCAHVEARALWPEALEAFGPRAHELTFLRSRATAAPESPAIAAPGSEGSKKTDDDRHSYRTGRRTVCDAGHRPVTGVLRESQAIPVEV
jgi:hypothetical protein